MLPFSRRNNADDEMELGDDDLVLVDSASASDRSDRSDRSDAGPSSSHSPRKRQLTPPGSRRILHESVEEDVAGECLASIAAETRIAETRDRHSSDLRAAIAPPPDAALPVSAPVLTRLPSVSPPPFARTAPGIRDASPVPAFVRRSSPSFERIPVSSTGTVEGKGSSVVPVSLGHHTPEPTVIIIRERPKATWIVAAAVIGALVAFGATRLVDSTSSRQRVVGAAGPAVVGAPVSSPAAPPVVVALPVVLAPGPALPAVMHFDDDQGVAITAFPVPSAARASTPAAPSLASRPAPRPRASAMGPLLPDGSDQRASASGPVPPAPPAIATVAAPAIATVAPPAKRVLTPEQQLAEAQLKASMK